MPKDVNNEDFEFVTIMGSKYQCSLCKNNRNELLDPVKKAKMVLHVNSKRHIDRVTHARLKVHPAIPLRAPTVDPVQPFLEDTDPPHLQYGSDASSTSATFISSPPLPPAPDLHPPIASSLDYLCEDPAIFDFWGNPLEDPRLDYAFDPDAIEMPEWMNFSNINESSLHANLTTRSKATRPTNPDCSPYPNRAHYLTHSLFNSPHVRFSVAQQQAILDWADEMGTPDLPTMYSIAKCQEELQNVMGDSSRMYTTDTGNVYYLNSIDAMVQQDFSNLRTRETLIFYPEDANNRSSEIWHGEKLVEGHNRKQLTPMVLHDRKTYFVDEVCELDDGSFFVPDMFLRREGTMWARGHCLTRATQGIEEVYFESAERILKPMSAFRYTCIDIQIKRPNGLIIQRIGCAETEPGLLLS